MSAVATESRIVPNLPLISTALRRVERQKRQARPSERPLGGPLLDMLSCLGQCIIESCAEVPGTAVIPLDRGVSRFRSAPSSFVLVSGLSVRLLVPLNASVA